MTLLAESIFEDVKSAMQQAEEMGGVYDVADYIELMTAIADEASDRAKVAAENA